jgi:protease-4
MRPNLLPTFLCALSAVPAAQDVAEPKKDSIQFVRPEGAYADLPEFGFALTSLLAGGGQPPKAFYELIDNLEKLRTGEGKLVLLDLAGHPQWNLPQLSELERTIGGLRKAGKKIVAYLEYADLGEYQVACLCDRVLIADMGVLDLRSPALSVMFFKDALDLLGVQMDIVRCGEFKGAVEPFMLGEMSRHLREHYRAMLVPINDDLVRRIASGRRLEAAKVRELQATRILTAKQAQAAGLVDRLVPWGDAQRALASELGVEWKTLEFASVLKKKKRSSGNPLALFTELFAPKKKKGIEQDSLVVLHLSGPIEDGEQARPGAIVSGPAVSAIRALAGDEKVRGVVVRVNSPGGSATASERVLLALQELAAKKPIAISMGDVAGSGGYYITCIGRPVFAEPGTITGSIGVFGMKPNAGALLRRIGLRQELVALDESAGMDAFDRGWSDADKAKLQGFVDEVYERFVGHVCAARKLQKQEVLDIAGGRVWSGGQAVERRLVDRIGGLQDAIALLREETKLGPDAPVLHRPEPKTMVDSLLDAFGEASVRMPKELLPFAEQLGLEQALAPLLSALRDPRPRVWAWMPAAVQLR